jgi:hypothetical protein
VRHGVASTVARARTLEAQTNVGYVLEQGPKLTNAALGSDDPAVKNQAIQSYNDQVDSLVLKGYRTPEQALQMKREFAHQYGVAATAAKIDTDPAGVIAELSNPNGTVYEFMRPAEREQLLRQARLGIQHLDRQVEVAAERERKAEGEERLKEIYSLSARGELRPVHIEAARPFISAAEYKNLVIGPDKAQDDPGAMIDLTTRIDTEDPVSFAKSAATYLRNGQLKTSTYLSLSEKNRAASRDDRPASPYKSGREIVRVTLDPGQLLSGPAAQIARTAQQQALTEYDNWAAANSRAGRAEHLTEAQETVKRYQIVPFDQMKLATGLSRYFGPRSREAVTSEDVDAAETKLMA